MTEDDPSQILMQGTTVWNAWRNRHPGSAVFRAPHWYDCPARSGRQLKGANRLDFSGMDLSGASIYKAFAEGLNLRESLFVGSRFEEGDFSRADFRGAIFRNTKFNKTILTGANFDGATFVNCNLNRVNLVEASFGVKEITETVVYGIAAWDLRTSAEMKQSKLVIEKTYELYSDLIRQETIPMMVDDIELAQFIYYLSNHKKMRNILNILNEKAVLLLGRFKDGGLGRLYSIREWLRGKGYMAMIFDFARPDSLSLTETVATMAGLSKFAIADLSGISVAAELPDILSQIKKPVLAFGHPYSLFPDLADQAWVRWVEVDDSNLLAGLEANLSEMEKRHGERIIQLARRYEKAETSAQ
jgi:uncharacterized protein YjbI with pentapeptide repeats